MRSHNSPNWCVFAGLPNSQKLAEQWNEVHWVGKSIRSDEHLLVISGSTSSARAIRRKIRGKQWNVDSVKAVLVRPRELRGRTEFDAPAVRQKYIKSQALDHVRHDTPYLPHASFCAVRVDLQSYTALDDACKRLAQEVSRH